jgi:hypothetical protein
LNILHINDLAGVAGCLCKYLRKEGHRADVISFMDDLFGFDQFYNYRHFSNQGIFCAVLNDILPAYDIIHLHYSFKFLEWLYAHTDKPIVMHYHGTELATETADCRLLDHRCKLVLTGAEQLLPLHPRAKYLPTIVDTEHFHCIPETEGFREGALTFAVSYLKTPKMADENYKLAIYDREKEAIDYKHLPLTLNSFREYIDVRHHKERGLLTDLSKTALEALACGLKVYCNGQWIKELPEQHKPENVVKQLIGYYEGILN